MTSTSHYVCASCGFQNRVGANFCGNCGESLATAILCPDCGANLESTLNFCGICGNRVGHASGAARAGEPEAASADLPRLQVPSITVPTTLFSVPARLRCRVAPISTPLLVAGALLVTLAQAYLAFAYEPGRVAPSLGVFALIAGFALFTVGAFGRTANDNTPDPLGALNIPPLRTVFGGIGAAKTIVAGLGGSLIVVLIFRLLAGSESGLDLLLWLVAVCALATPFICRLNLSLKRLVPPIERFPDFVIVLALVGIFVALNTHDLTDWYYSAIGDEYAHYNYARELAEDGLRRPFDLDGVYGEINPVMASIYPAMVMKMLGVGNFAWKFSLIFSIAITIPAMYILGYALAGRIAAVVSVSILAFSHYIFAFMHTGYPNTDVMPLIVWSIALFVLGVRRGNSFLIYASGLLAGFGLLFNIVARAAVAIILLYAISHPDIRRRLASLWPWALGVSLTVVPLIFANGDEVLSTALVKIVGPGSQHASEYDGILSQVVSNAVRNLLAFNYNSQTSHYVSGALLDPISAILALLGLAYCLGTMHKPSSRLLLILFAVIATGTALLSPYPYVPFTRMSSMLIPLALMAGIAAVNLIKVGTPSFRGDKQSLPAVPTVTILSLLGAVVLALNAWQFWYATPRVFHHTQEAVAIGAMRSEACEGEPDSLILVGRSTIPLLKPALESYHPDGALPHLLDHSDVKSDVPLPADSPRCVIFLNPEDAEIQAFKQDLATRYPQGEFSIFSNPSGKTSVEVFTPFAG